MPAATKVYSPMAPAATTPTEDDVSATAELIKKKGLAKRPKRPAALPVSRKTLNLLQELHKDLPASAREAKVQAIVHASLADAEGLDSTGNAYVLKRLIAGVSASAGHARANYASVLCRLSADADVVWRHVDAVYGADGSFNGDYARAKVERAVGSLTACAALVRGARVMPAATARNVVEMLRTAVAPDALKWNLAPAVMLCVRQLLAAVDDASTLKDALWQWVVEQKATYHGLSLALLLVMERKLVPYDALCEVYATLDDVAKPLMALFGSGFPIKPPCDAPPQVDGLLAISAVHSPTWALMLLFCASDEGQRHFGGVAAFWEKVVAPNLMVSNVEKKRLAACLVPLAVSHLAEVDGRDKMLSEFMLTKVCQLLKDHGAVAPAESLRAVARCVTAALEGGCLPNADRMEVVSSLSDALKKLNAGSDKLPAAALKCLGIVGNFFVVHSFRLAVEEDEDAISRNTPLCERFCSYVSTVLKEGGAEASEDAPDALQEVTHLLCVLSVESPVFAPAFKHAAALLGECANDGVIAVLFDMLDQAKEVERSRDEEDEDCVDEFSVDGEEESEEEEDEDMVAIPVDRDNPMEEPITNVENADFDILDAEMNPDDEDPAILAAFDNHLSNHMKLINAKKAADREERAVAKRGVDRTITLIATVLNSVRLVVERTESEVQLAAVFFDMFLRFAEFVHSKQVNNSKHANYVATVCKKNLSRKQVFVERAKGWNDVVLDFKSRLAAVIAAAAARPGRFQEMTSNVAKLSAIVNDVADKVAEAEKEQAEVETTKKRGKKSAQGKRKKKRTQ